MTTSSNQRSKLYLVRESSKVTIPKEDISAIVELSRKVAKDLEANGYKLASLGGVRTDFFDTIGSIVVAGILKDNPEHLLANPFRRLLRRLTDDDTAIFAGRIWLHASKIGIDAKHWQIEIFGRENSKELRILSHILGSKYDVMMTIKVHQDSRREWKR